MLRMLSDGGQIDTSAVEVNADYINELIPEYHELKQAGDGRAAATVHEESSLLSRLLDPAQPRYSIIYDATHGHKSKHSATHRSLEVRRDCLGVSSMCEPS